jgi:hypothetical protein
VNPGWSLEDLDAVLADAPERAVTRKRVQEQDPTYGELEPILVDIERLPPLLRHHARATPKPNRRSHQTFALVLCCIELDFPPGVALYLCTRHRPSVDKQTSRGGGRSLTDDVRDIYAMHPHRGSRCFEVGCPNVPVTSALVKTLRELYVSVRAMPWPAKTRNLRDLLAAMLLRAASEGSASFAISIRDLAMEAGMSRTTAEKWVREVVRRGWARRVGTNAGVVSQSYRLSLDRVGTLNPQRGGVCGAPVHRAACGLSVPTLSALEDLRRPGRWHQGQGFGKTAIDVYFMLLPSKLTEQELSEGLGCHAKTVRRALTKLSEFDAVRKVGDRWSANEDVDWATVADLCGVLGRVADQHQQFQRERAAYRDLVSQQRADWKDQLARMRYWQEHKHPRPRDRSHTRPQQG